MHLGASRQQILIFLGLLLVVVPVIGLPLLLKNILVIASGLLLITILLTAGEQAPVEADSLVVASEIVESVVDLPVPSLYHEPVPEFYQSADLVLSPIKPKTIRRRRVKTTSLEPIEDHAHTV